MNKILLTLLIVATVFALVFLLLNLAFNKKISMTKRLNKMMAGDTSGEGSANTQKRKKQNIRKKTSSSIKALEKVENLITSAGLLVRPGEFIMIWCFTTGVPSLILYLATGNITVSFAALAIGVFLPPYVLFRKKAKRLELFEKQLVEAIVIISNSLKSGLTLQQAIISISQEMPEPISKEFGRIIREVNLGRGLDTALANSAERLGSKDFMMIVSAILIQRQIGGNLSDILSNIAGTIKERFTIKNEIRVLTTTGRSSGRVVGLMPVFILLFFMLVNPSYVEGFFNTTIGIIMLAVAAVLETIGFLIIGHIVNIKY